MTRLAKSNATLLLAFVIVATAVAGYFTGLQAPMKGSTSTSRSITTAHKEVSNQDAMDVVPATHYRLIGDTLRAQHRSPQLTRLKPAVDRLAEIRISPEDKQIALQQRARNRAFNGAPPTIPHPIDQRVDASCIACHRDGAISRTLRIPRMSHGFLASCLQCHVEANPQHASSDRFPESDFAGLAAPAAGPRAFPGAPPLIPHSTWMRSECMSCHGYEGLQGIRTTHPWRIQCQQCHAPSATMDQTLLARDIQFISEPKISQ